MAPPARSPQPRSHGGRILGILGAGRQALETSGYCAEVGLTPVFFVEEARAATDGERREFSAPIVSFEALTADQFATPVISAVGQPEVRATLIALWRGSAFATLVSPHAWLAQDAVIGAGTTIAPHAALNRLVTIGAHVLVNVGAILSHDVSVGDFATISPGCVVGGCVSIGESSFLGIGVTVRDHISIGRGAFVAAGAVVIADVADGESVRGVPARVVGR
jgi:sugar O-acyltransferase (sialic acid O-acetyltransferase NeuD family)